MCAESSQWFDGDTYNANVFDNVWADVFTPGLAASAGVIKGVGGNLAVTGATSPVAVATGAAIVNGKYYANGASINVTVATPATSTRIDRIILRCTYASKTITCVRLAGAEGGSAPALTQTDGTTWEISLAQVLITTGGAITVTNERKWSRPRGQWLKGQITPFSGTFSGHYPVDLDTGVSDTDWHLCNGDTEGGVVTPNLADRFVIAAGGTYAAGATGGAATKNLVHVHAQAVHLHAQAVHLHAQTVHAHGATGLSTGNAGSHMHSLLAGSGIASGTLNVQPSTDTSADHTHAVNGNTANSAAANTGNSAAADTGNSAAVDTGNGGSATQDIMPPYYSLAYIAYVGA